MSEIAQNIETAYKTAKQLNLNVVVPDEYTLQLDIDQEPKYWPSPYQVQLLALIDINFGIRRINTSDPEGFSFDVNANYDMVRTSSKSGNLHVYIKLVNSITATERLVFQAALGSDPKRELLSLARLKRGEPNPTLLFEVKKVENNLDCGVQTGYERV